MDVCALDKCQTLGDDVVYFFVDRENVWNICEPLACFIPSPEEGRNDPVFLVYLTLVKDTPRAGTSWVKTLQQVAPQALGDNRHKNNYQ